MPNSFQVPLKYSQNFIKDQSLIEKLIETVHINKDDIVIDIGAGNGMITKALSKYAKRVIAIERDPKLFAQLKSKFGNSPNAILVEGDFLDYELPPRDQYKVFSNIPFSITSEITRRLFNFHNPPIETFLVLQKEVALKFIGEPALFETQSSLLLKPFFQVYLVQHFKREDFYPVPNVDISFVRFLKRERPLIDKLDKKLYSEFIIYGFNQTKPNIRMSLRKIFSNLQMKIIAEELKFGIDAKPSDLSFEQWLGLFRKFVEIVPRYKWKVISGMTIRQNDNIIGMRKKNLTLVRKYY